MRAIASTITSVVLEYVRVGGINYTTNVLCNPLYTVYSTTPNKNSANAAIIRSTAKKIAVAPTILSASRIYLGF
ncbi:hypothetical protein BV372_16675 [Nostoc sp. T09]|nr:hypothetical protein BV372_16675 [Nostoc sp. T09]